MVALLLLLLLLLLLMLMLLVLLVGMSDVARRMGMRGGVVSRALSVPDPNPDPDPIPEPDPLGDPTPNPAPGPVGDIGEIGAAKFFLITLGAAVIAPAIEPLPMEPVVLFGGWGVRNSCIGI